MKAETFTTEQIRQFNQMLSALKKIADDYMGINELEEKAEDEYNLDYLEALEMSYENIQDEARRASHGIQPITERPSGDTAAGDNPSPSNPTSSC